MKALRIHCFQHVDFEGLGCIKDWADVNGHRVTYTRFLKNDRIPSTQEFDWLIVMGGPMGIKDEDKHPWLYHEKRAIKQSIENDKTVIGICLGAQLIADVLGAEVYKNPEKEIGWFDVALTEQADKQELFSQTEEALKAFHWHGDSFEIPANSKHLAFSEACRNQAFLYKENVLGLQFHFEVTKEGLEAMLKNGKSELVKGKYIQSKEEIFTQQDTIFTCNSMMLKILDRLQSNYNTPKNTQNTKEISSISAENI